MAQTQVSVKWNSKTFTLNVEPNEPIELFQAQLLTLTGVPVDRQKLMFKAKLLKTDDDLAKACTSPPPIKFMLMGTAGEVSHAPAQKTVFIEDLTPQELAVLLKEKQAAPLPNGIINLGNTCFLASVLQLLRPVKELSTAIRTEISQKSLATITFAASGSSGGLIRLGLALRDFYNQWEHTIDAVSPLLLVSTLREAFPQFSKRSTSEAGTVGTPMQQDAEECLGCIFSALDECLTPAKESKVVSSLPYKSLCNDEKSSISSTLDSLFSIHYKVENKRLSEEMPTETAQIEKHRKLVCFLGTPSAPVNTLDEGLKLIFSAETISSGSDSMPIQRESKISGISLYLLVQFMRFEWRQHENNLEKAKICKSVKFAPTLDIYLHCTPELQETMKTGRAILAYRKKLETQQPPTEDNKEQDNNKDAENSSETAQKYYPTGMFSLQSVLTHQGRYADSGHYISWVSEDKLNPQSEPSTPVSTPQDTEPITTPRKKCKVTDTWIKFDDDKVSVAEWQNIDLCGGRSDYHVAYLLLFKHIIVKPTAQELKAIEAETA